MAITRVDAGDPARIADLLARRFAELHGRQPTGCFMAPGRVNLIGEHVDYNGGRCLPMALPHATYAAMAPRRDDTFTVTSLQQDTPWTGRLDELGPGRANGWVAYVAGVAWALQEEGVRLPGMDIVVDSRVPIGAGLSSSAALECSVALGLCAVSGMPVDAGARSTLVVACMRAEAEVAGAPTGGMDQTVSLFAEVDHALLIDCRDWTTRQLPWDPGGRGLVLLVFDTRASHALTSGGYESRRADCERAADLLGVRLLREVEDPDRALAEISDDLTRRRARHVLTEMGRVDQAVAALEAGDYAGLGHLFTASHVSLRDDFEVSCAELDTVVEIAGDHGALGARMTGGGFGGSAIALVPRARASEVVEAVDAAFARSGWAPPGLLEADPSGGARQVG